MSGSMAAKKEGRMGGGRTQVGQLKLLDGPEMTALTALTPSSGDGASFSAGDIGAMDVSWYKHRPPGPQTIELCKRLSELGTLFRMPDGQIVELKPGKEPRFIRDSVDLESVIRENLTVAVVNEKGKTVANAIPPKDLQVLLRSKVLQTALKVIDRITEVPTFNSLWQLTKPGYNAGPEGERYFYTGAAVIPKRSPDLIRKFLDIMPFKSGADATNAVALALTVLLRFFWPGAKGFGAITGNKSGVGKDTVVDFATGLTKSREISYHHADWACQNEAVAALSDPAVGVLKVGNVRSQGRIIESAFLEMMITSPKSLMQSSKRRGDGFERNGDLVVMLTANNGKLSSDLANRSLPSHLELIGDPSTRVSEIGDPRDEFLPQNMAEIQAELCGMIENWKDQGCPLDMSVNHRMRPWAQTIGGILKANDFADFLGNWSLQRSSNDSIREALALIAHALPHGKKDWQRVSKIVQKAVNEGLVGVLMERRHQESARSMERQLGVLLTSHRDEPLHLETVKGAKTYVIRKGRILTDKTVVAPETTDAGVLKKTAAMMYRIEEITPATPEQKKQ